MRPVPFKVRLFLTHITRSIKSASELITLAFTIVLAVATVALVGTAIVQHFDTIDANRATNRLAKAAEDSATETAAQTNLHRRTLELSQRAYVYFYETSLTPSNQGN